MGLLSIQKLNISKVFHKRISLDCINTDPPPPKPNFLYAISTSSPMGNDRSLETESQYNVGQCSKAGNSKLETAIRPKFKHKIIFQFCVSAVFKKTE